MKYSNEVVLDTSLSAMTSAGFSYEKWTKGNYAPWQAPEYIYTTNIAQSVAALPFKPGVYCEYNSKDAISWANKASFGRRLAKLTSRSRSDILVANANDDFRYIIEVKKRVWSKTKIENDVGRIPDIIVPNKASTVSSGASVFFVCYSGESQKDARGKLDEFITANSKNYSDVKRYDTDAWLIRGAKEYLGSRKFSVKLHVDNIIRQYVAVGDDEETDWAWTSCALEIKPERNK